MLIQNLHSTYAMWKICTPDDSESFESHLEKNSCIYCNQRFLLSNINECTTYALFLLLLLLLILVVVVVVVVVVVIVVVFWVIVIGVFYFFNRHIWITMCQAVTLSVTWKWATVWPGRAVDASSMCHVQQHRHTAGLFLSHSGLILILSV